MIHLLRLALFLCLLFHGSGQQSNSEPIEHELVTLRKEREKMKIVQSNVTMTSDRQYWQMGNRTDAGEKRVESFQSIAAGMYSRGGRGQGISEGWLNYGQDGFHIVSPNSITVVRIYDLGSIRNDLVNQLIQRMKEGGLFSKTAGWTIRKDGMTFSFTTQTIDPSQYTYVEAEETNFRAKGVARTEDGRVIDFGVNVEMTRNYMEYMNIAPPSVESVLVDPLVINVGAEVTKLSDQTFMFDLDADGIKEEISVPGSGSGFLALDLNNDGIINDGNELFGAKTGDGFADLRRYDRDGNGWIDENDEVYYKLKVWCVGENGKSTLMNLKEADVGAIFLGEQSTGFSLQNSEGETTGVIRSTGIFLRETGDVGTIQHVDFAKCRGGKQIEYHNM